MNTDRVKVDNHLSSMWFHDNFLIHSGHNIPADYFIDAETYSFYNRFGVVGGFCLNHGGFRRVIMQMPGRAIDMMDEPWKKIICRGYYSEATGLFIAQPKLAFPMLVFGLWRVVMGPHKYFIYSYDKVNINLEKLYSYAAPIRLYSGKVINLEGMTGDHFENIELITRFGFFRLFFFRILRRINKWISR